MYRTPYSQLTCRRVDIIGLKHSGSQTIDGTIGGHGVLLKCGTIGSLLGVRIGDMGVLGTVEG